jgi:immune inhibitor A
MAVAMMAQPAGAAPKLPDYQPMVIGDMFRGDVASPDLIQDLGEAPAMAAAGDATAAAGAPPVVGTQKLWLIRTLTGYGFTTFTLRGVGVHGEVWVQNNLNFPANDPRNPVTVTTEQVAYLIDQFDNNMYAKETAMWTVPDNHTGENALLTQDNWVSPDGVDRTVILVSNIRDDNYYTPTYPVYIAGFFSSTYESYFDRNVMTIDAYDWGNRVGPNTSPWRPADGAANDRPYLYEGTFAHEYQHLLHRDMDSDEENWINEGMSDFAELLTGYTDLNTDGHINAFLNHPYNSLTSWEDMGNLEVLSDYGAAYLMQLYLYQNYGTSFIQDLAWNQENGIAGVNSTLAQAGIPRSFADIYRDWSTAVLINSKTAATKYSFQGLDKRVVLDNAGDDGPNALPWGPAYYRISAKPKITNLTLQGISFLPTPWSVVADPMTPANQVLFGGGGNLASNMAILPVDLTSAADTTLRFKTLYDIEELWDYGMVQVSADQGATWTSLSNPATTSAHDPAAHPDIIANLPGLTGVSDGWVDMAYDLSAYQGESILLAFRYMTDWGSLGNGALAAPGWYVDEITVGGQSLDGSSIAPFQSFDQIQQRYADYLITFAGKMRTGNAEWKVLQLQMQTFGESSQLEVQKFLRDASLDEVIVIVSYAAPQGVLSGIPFGYDVERQADRPQPLTK